MEEDWEEDWRAIASEVTSASIPDPTTRNSFIEDTDFEIENDFLLSERAGARSFMGNFKLKGTALPLANISVLYDKEEIFFEKLW